MVCLEERGSGMEVKQSEAEEAIKNNIIMTSVEHVLNLCRSNSLWPVTFGLACCAIEMMATGGARYDLSRFGFEVFRPSPRQADLMIVAGTVTHKMVPLIRRLYDQMPEPKYVIAMGNCAIGGGPFVDSYSVLPGIDTILPVDVYITGCSPRPEALIDGFLKLRDKIRNPKIAEVKDNG
jgi:NADH-quinone oxidoreductase subunit B